jgi:predicted GNAT family N-acyltransferase
MQFSIKPALEPVELDRLYRFRYAIYVEEMHRPQLYADHEKHIIADPLDSTALNLVGFCGDEIVGCMRCNLSRNGGLDFYQKLLRMDKVPTDDFPGRTALCTRLMVRSDFRNSSLSARLFLEHYKRALSNGIRWAFMDCNDHLVSLFARLGFVQTHTAIHPEYGQVNAMRLDLFDIEHLRSCQSLFVPALEQWLAKLRQGNGFTEETGLL